MKEKDDDTLVALGVAGSAAALEELYRRHRSSLLGYAYRMTGDRALAEDVVQETFVYFFRNLRRYEPRGKLVAYLFRIARSLALDQKRAARRSAPGVAEPVSGDAEPLEDREAAENLAEKVRQAMLALPEHLREIVELRLFQGFDYARVAELTGVPEATARSRLRYALEALRRALGVRA